MKFDFKEKCLSSLFVLQEVSAKIQMMVCYLNNIVNVRHRTFHTNGKIKKMFCLFTKNSQQIENIIFYTQSDNH